MIAFTACSDNTVENGDVIERNFPFLKVGNSWDCIQYSTDFRDGTIDTNEATISLTRRENWDTVFNEIRYEVAVFFGSEEVDGVIIKEDREIFIANDSNATSEKVSLPLFWKDYYVGKKWDSGNPNGITIREVVSINETVTVKAGTFNNCIKIKEYSEKDKDDVDYWWIKNDVGIIKCKSEYSDMELKSKNF